MAVLTREEADRRGYEYCPRNGCPLKGRRQIKPKKRCGGCGFSFNPETSCTPLPEPTFAEPPDEALRPMAVIVTIRSPRTPKKRRNLAGIGSKIRKLREIMGISTEELSVRCQGLLPAIITDIEDGRMYANFWVRKRLAQALDVTLEFLEEA